MSHENSNGEIPVTADRPEGALHLSGTDHVTLIGSNEEDTVAFYRDILGMPLILRQPNLDAPNVTHLFFDTGDGRVITFFVEEGRRSNPAPQRTGIGAVHHLAFRFEPERLEEIKEGLEANGHRYNVFDRSIFYSLYTSDHNGLTLELTTDKFDIPDDRRAEVLATAQRLREEDGSEYAKAEHLEAALEELGIPVEPVELPDAPTGAGV
ncbi:VOC family protein [Haladaptatus pallidirubidus]|uniref:VOC family protein n=1 Tax=Haladaptatus pallidirubidus TaxID=1008152 RepID=A0AAV3UMF4_9EURY|nr:VOC family protein [Haladaptatus pallidirubidus]